MVFNGLINIASIEYLKLCELVMVLLTTSSENDFMSSLLVYGIICSLIGYWALTTHILYTKSDEELL